MKKVNPKEAAKECGEILKRLSVSDFEKINRAMERIEISARGIKKLGHVITGHDGKPALNPFCLSLYRAAKEFVEIYEKSDLPEWDTEAKG